MHIRQLRGWLVRLFGLFHRKRREREFAEELESHLALHIEDNLRAGLSPEEARRLALIKLGGVTLTKERCREQGGLPVLKTLFQDLRFGGRMLLKHKGFTFVTLLILALGIGVNTALFTVFNAVALRPLPIKEPDRIVKVYRKDLGKSNRQVSGSTSMLSYPEFTAYRESTQSFSGLTAYADVSLTLGGAEAEPVKGLLVAENYFSVLGTEMAQGRPLHGKKA